MGLLVAVVVAAGCGSNDGAVSAVDPSAVEPSASEPSAVDASPNVERAVVDPDAPVEELVAGFSDAGFELMRVQPFEGNLVFSPLSIGHALLMARGAADDETGAAIDAAFGLPEAMSAHDAWNALDRALAASNGTAVAIDETESPIVTVADRLWPSTDAAPDQAWIDLMASHHATGVETIDVADGDRARDRINSWISEQTNELIPELLPAGFINPNTVLVLTDTVYFKAQWRSIFGKYGPEAGTFTQLDGTRIETSFLVDLEQPGPRGRGNGFVGAEIPYLGDDYAMLLVVPDDGRFEEVRQRLSVDLLAEIDAGFTTGPYELRMPEWKTTTTIDLIGWLSERGVAPGAYPGIGPGVFLDGAIHGADITVDEVGTEAAAATALDFAESGPPEPQLVVAADRPFIYLVRHVDSGAVLFAGQVTDPNG